MVDHDHNDDAKDENDSSVASDLLHDNGLMLRNGHISLFGEIIHDSEPIITEELGPLIFMKSTNDHDGITKEDGALYDVI